MKKKDIIQLVKNVVKENTFYGNREQPNQLSTGTKVSVPTDEYPFSAKPKRTATGMMEDESTSFKVVNADTGKTIDFGIDQAKAEEIVAAAKEDNINAKVVKMKNVDDVGKLKNEAGPSNNPYYNNLVKKAKEMGIHVNDLMKSLLKDKSEMEIVKMGYQDVAALAGVENLSEGQDTLSSEMLKYADIHHNELVGGYREVSLHPDKRTGGFKIVFPHFNGPEGRGALFGPETVDQIEKSKAAAKAAALKTASKFKDQIEEPEITTKSRGGVHGSVHLFIMPKTMNEMHDFEKKYGDKIDADNFKNNPKLQPGKKVTYLGTSRTIVKNNGIILTLDNGTTVNLGQFNQKGAIKEKDMKNKIKEAVVVSKMSDKGDAADLAKSASTTVDAVKTAIDQAKLTGDEVTVAEEEDLTFEPEDMDNPDEDLVIIGSGYLDIENKFGERPPMTNGEYAAKGQWVVDNLETITKGKQKNGDKEAALNYIYSQINEGEFTNDMGKDKFIDDEGRHAKMQLQKAAEYSIKLAKMMDDMTQLPSWVQSKITKASDYMSAVYHYLDYEMANSQDNLMENIDKYKKRSMLMEGAMKKFFEMFDKGKTDEEIVQDYAHKGTQVPEPFVKNARKQYEGMKKLKLELEMSEKEFRNSSEKMVNNAEEGMEYEGEEKTLASGLTNEEPNEGNKFGYEMQKAKETGDDSFELDGETFKVK